jgi:hypothetical protein
MLINMKFFTLLALLFAATAGYSQLDFIGRVTLQDGHPQGNTSFLLTYSDYHLWIGQPAAYNSSLQIIDADQPWPPRWFATNPQNGDTGALQWPLPMFNASIQNNKLVFVNGIPAKPGASAISRPSIIICDTNLAFVDTFYRYGQEFDGHDFKISPSGEVLYFSVNHATVDMRSVFQNQSDSAVNITYEIINIADATGKIVFTWNPLEKLGVGAMHAEYRMEKSFVNNRVMLGWSHGNSLAWDYDGNILYSYKYLGIGKISRADGHVIWKVERNHQKPNALSDSIPIFLQHDFKSNHDANGKIFYSVLSNGDSLHPFCAAYQFTVQENTGKEPIIKIIKAFRPDPLVPNSGLGNYDVAPDGEFLIHYGIYVGDTVSVHKKDAHTLFEWRKNDNQLIARYTVPPYAFCYRVHQLQGWRPKRPEVVVKNGMLTTVKNYEHCTWYKLTGADFKVVEQVGAGKQISPSTNGTYCVTVKSGIGFAVSKPISFTKK